MELKRWPVARDALQLALAEEPQSPILHLQLSEVCTRLRCFADAECAAREAAALAPQWSQPYYWLALSLILQGSGLQVRQDEAMQAAETALACAPEDVHSHYICARAALFAGSRTQTRSYALSGLDCDPDNQNCLELLASLQMDAEQPQEAESNLRRLLELNPESSLGHYLMAKVQFGRQRFGESYEHIAAAIRLDPTDQDTVNLHSEVVKHQHPLARILLFLTRQWERMPYIMGILGMLPLGLLAMVSPSKRDVPALLAVAVVAFALIWMTAGLWGLLAAETIISFSRRYSRLVPESRSKRFVYASVWAGTLIAVTGVLATAIWSTPQPILLAGNMVVAGIAVMIGQWAATRTKAIAAMAAAAIPLAMQIAAFCWAPDESMRGSLMMIVLVAWCITIIVALVGGGRALDG
jgi:Flp pilus assembly protein TadD